jgi:DNA polymerase-3 subunit gamma/tau
MSNLRIKNKKKNILKTCLYIECKMTGTKMADRVLNISLRPQQLDDIIGQDDIVKSIKSQFESGRIPHFFLIVGPTGSGKSTIARIIALMLQLKNPLKDKIDYSISKYDIKEINASDKNGIDDVRALIDIISQRPLSPSLSKVIIMDEMHQLTTPAQNALLKDTEDVKDHVFFIGCTNNDSKILPTLKRRAYIITTHGIDQSAVKKLLLVAKKKTGFKGEIKELEDALIENEITSPGLILQSAEKYFNGFSATDSVSGPSSGSVDTKKLCQILLKGDWKGASPILKTMTKEDIVMVRNCVLGYFKAVLMNTGSVKTAQAMKIIGEEPLTYELPTFLANLCIACNIIKSV